MAEYTPPTDNVPIFDVSNFISSSGAGLTESQIATKFLRFPTGQGTETLPTLITGNITTSNTLDIVMPNTSASNVLNVGVVTRNISGQVHHYSDGNNCVAGAGVHLNNGNNNASSTNISNGTTTSGQVNILTGANSIGTINLGGVDSFNNILGTNTILGTTNINTSGPSYTNIGNAIESTKTIITGTTEINNANSATTNIGNTGLTTLNGATLNINTIGGTDTTIGKNSAGTTSLNNPTVNLGRAGTSTTTVRGIQVNISGTTNSVTGVTNINTSGTTATTIGNSSSITAINGQTDINISNSGQTTIGTPTTSNTTIRGLNSTMNATTNSIIGTINLNGVGLGSTDTSLITIGNPTNGGITTLSSPTINVGNSTTTNVIKGITNINTTGGGTTAIGTVNTGTTSIKGRILNIFDDIVTGASPYPTINIGKYNGDEVRRTSTNINGDVNIGFIGGGDTTINRLFTDNIFALTNDSLLDLGTNLTTGQPLDNLAIRIGENLSSGKIEIGKNQTTGSILIGSGNATTNTRNITLGNTTGAFDTNTTISGKTTINKLTLTAPITSAYTVVPTAGQLGFIPTAIFNAGDATLEVNNFTMTSFTNYSVGKIELTPGTWIITGSLRANSNSSFGSVICAITPIQASVDFATDFYVQSFNASFIDLNFLATRIVQVTATQFYFLTSRSSANSQIINNYKLTATRIA